MQPIVNRLEDAYQDQVSFVALDARDGGDGEQIFNQLSLPGHPTILLYSATGEQAYRGVGVLTEAQLEEQIQMAIVNTNEGE